MRLEGTLDAFSLPDIFQLLSFTKKTGALHLRRNEAHGVVHLKDGAVTGARADIARQALGRRLVSSGLVSDETLADAVESLLEHPELGLGKALSGAPGLDPAQVMSLAREQATDAVFDLMRWPEGAFAFVVDEVDPDDVGGSITVEEAVAEVQRRIETWSTLQASVPSTSSVVLLNPSPGEAPTLDRDEWGLLCLVDGVRTVADLVDVSGRGEFVVVRSLAGLVDRGIVRVSESTPDDSPVARRQALLAALEGSTTIVSKPVVPAAPAEPVEVVAVVEVGEVVEAVELESGLIEDDSPEPSTPVVVADRDNASSGSDVEDVEDVEDASGDLIAEDPEDCSAAVTSLHPQRVGERATVIPERPEPFTPPRQPDHREEPVPALARMSAKVETMPVAAAVGAVAGHGTVQGAHALKPDPASVSIERDPSVNKSLLLRLIAGVRGL